jgi:hypothetical protein
MSRKSLLEVIMWKLHRTKNNQKVQIMEDKQWIIPTKETV